MSILGTIMSKVLGKKPAATPAAAPSAAGSTKVAANTAANANVASSQATPASSVDVAATLEALKDKATQELDWKHSIVDLMKLLSLDSSLAARKELAKELHYTGDTSDSATMNIWLHKQIMIKLAENGGKLPDDMKH
jgi:hypothetical protein